MRRKFMENQTAEHSLTVLQRKKTCVTGVSEVDGFTAERINLTLVGGKTMIISGENLKIAAFSKQSGALSVDGTICDVRYAGERLPLIKKIFR